MTVAMTAEAPAAPFRSGAARARRLLRHAAAIGGELRAAAVETRDGSVTWMAPAAPDAPRKLLDPHLYGGTSGIALFLAALDHARGTDEHAGTVRRALAPLRRTLAGLHADPARAAALRLPLGGIVGIGSWVYALARAGTWLGDAAMVADAHAATALLTPERIAADQHLDVVKGSAGAVLALLALDAVESGPNARGETPLELAVRCGAHLLACRVASAAGPRAWVCPGAGPLTGFAHGASGIGYSLLRLFARTGNRSLRDAALEGFAFERTLYLPGQGDWWDPRFGRPLMQNAWCYGAPGMSLARAAATDDADAAADFAMTVPIARDRADEPVDHLCCGTLGRADVLLTLSRRMDDPSLAAAAGTLAMRALRAREARGHYALPAAGEAQGSPLGLFSGTAGIGYALLRLAAPSLPSPLCLD
ncbi:MAG TPA: lanthionine synthetase LanC family protein [Longimicrobium sp.]|nr:lanthionine synthetase LanC family protein [Longimicrobium sp.]